jgi:F-type H+-transporting ATPase subunit delta
MTSSAVVTRYANALADVVMGGSRAGIQPGDAAAQLQAFAQLVQESPNLRNALLSPSVSLVRKRAVISRLVEMQGVAPMVRNFLLVLSDHRRLDALSEVASTFATVVDERLGFTRADIQSAQPLRPQQQDALVQKISQLTGKNVRPNYSVNPQLLGGVVVNVGSKVYDGSVRGQLAAIGRRLITR